MLLDDANPDSSGLVGKILQVNLRFPRQLEVNLFNSVFQLVPLCSFPKRQPVPMPSFMIWTMIWTSSIRPALTRPQSYS